jgi:hypothetical protein
LRRWRRPPPPGGGGGVSLTTTIGAAGDWGSYPASRGVIADMLRRDTGHALDLVHQFGDIAYTGGNQSLWDAYLDLCEPLFATTPALVSPGNHDGAYRFGNDYTRGDGGETGEAYALRFAGPGPAVPWRANGNVTKPGEGPTPSTSFYYSADHNLVHLVATSGVHPFAPGTAQYKWLEADLAAAHANRAAVPWLVLSNHFPMYCTLGDCFCNYTAGATCEDAAHSSEGILEVTADFVRVPLEPLLLKYEVDFVLSGHEHSYERTLPVADKEVVGAGAQIAHARNASSSSSSSSSSGGGGRGAYGDRFVDPKAPIHVMVGTGGGGPDSDWRTPDAWSARRSDTAATVNSPYGWLKVRVAPGDGNDEAGAAGPYTGTSTATLTFFNTNVTNAPYDEFTVTKHM